MSLDDDLRAAFLTAGLDDRQRADLIAVGDETTFGPGDELFSETEVADHLWILLDGEIELTRRVGNQRITVATMTAPGQWAGGLAAWGGDTAHYRASGRALTHGRCLLVPSDELARLVNEWSPFGQHMITGIYQTIRGIDATAREREALVALGTLAAGLAHEINNPASAALRGVEAIRDTSEYMLSALIGLADHGITAEAFLALDRLRVDLQERPRPAQSALASSDREEVVGTWMEDREIALAWRIAPVLATVDIDEQWLDDLETAVGEEALDPALRWVSSTIGNAALLEELAEATARISHLVEDVKTYSQLDRADSQCVDVSIGIESTLAILRPKLHGIEVVRDFDPDVPPIDVHAAELNQVWTNLIENAVDAMGGEGTLRLSIRVDGGHVVVDVTDSGPGIPVEVQQRVFEPFFTTKDVGKGTGLGLDISRRIVVDRHGGDIEIDSGPGSTTVSVRLPVSS